MVVALRSPIRNAAGARVQPHHRVKLQPPWFAGADGGTTLHRYMDEQFVPNFLREAQSGTLVATRSVEWYQKDRVGRHRDMPTLRLPMHRAFYTACCQVYCDIPGQPALDPSKVVSAGMVVRRGRDKLGAQRWMVRDGQALGWKSGAINELDPDENRRLLKHGLRSLTQPDPPYDGEETFPMHAQLLPADKLAKRVRACTLLWGYLPLGGSARAQADDELDDTSTGPLEVEVEVAWPFGSRDPGTWSLTSHRPILDGRASPAMYDLLEALLRLGVTNAEDSDNAQLRQLLAQIHFHVRPPTVPMLPYNRHAVPADDMRRHSLLHWLDQHAEAIQTMWIVPIALGHKTVSQAQLPHTHDLATRSFLDLYLTQDQADLLRILLVRRLRQRMARNDEGVALPKYPQGDDDVFHVQPFVRWIDECGCEQITWGPSSLPFRVASPLDPDYQRPHAIILPSLADLRRGAARGMALMAPKSLADKLRALRPEMPPEDGGPGNRCGLCWMVSLSIPVVTICAVIILMVLINVLNFLFGWLPWAILALPRLCGKLLKE